MGINYITAFFGLIEKAKLKDGETVLVTGASGGVGSSVVKIAKSKGARVIAVDRQVMAPEMARRLGIDLALSGQSDDIVNRAKQFTQGKGVDVAFDCVGGPLFEVALNSLGLGGRQLNITSVGDRRVSFDLIDFYHRRLTLYGIDTLSLDVIASGDVLETLRPSFEQGLLTPPSIEKTCSLEEAVEAYHEVETGKTKGKIVITFPH